MSGDRLVGYERIPQSHWSRAHSQGGSYAWIFWRVGELAWWWLSKVESGWLGTNTLMELRHIRTVGIMMSAILTHHNYFWTNSGTHPHLVKWVTCGRTRILLGQNEKSGNPRSHAIHYTQGTPTEYNSKRPGTKTKAKAHKMPKKGRRMWPKMWPRSHGFWGRSNVNRCNGIWNERRIRCPTHASSRADSSSTSGALVQKEYMEAPVSGGKIANCKRQEKSFHVKKVKEVFYMSTSVYTKSFARR